MDYRHGSQTFWESRNYLCLMGDVPMVCVWGMSQWCHRNHSTAGNQRHLDIPWETLQPFEGPEASNLMQWAPICSWSPLLIHSWSSSMQSFQNRKTKDHTHYSRGEALVGAVSLPDPQECLMLLDSRGSTIAGAPSGHPFLSHSS